jgi:sugar phosphate isomerase/epimerase
MSARSGHWNDFGMDTISLAGSLETKMRAIRDAGFEQVMLSAADLSGHPGGVGAALACVKSSGLRVMGFQLLRDFEGLGGALHAYKVDVAKSLIEMCAEVGAPILVASSSALAHSTTDRDHIVADLRKLAMLAIPSGVKVAYSAASWGRAVADFPSAIDIVARATMPNLGIAIDSFHALASMAHLEELDFTLPSEILLVQLSDFMTAELPSNEERMSTASHLRVFPGEGLHSERLAELVRRLGALGYRGNYSFQVYNDDYLQMDPARVTQRARRCAIWLGEEVLRRSVPLPWAVGLRRGQG